MANGCHDSIFTSWLTGRKTAQQFGVPGQPGWPKLNDSLGSCSSILYLVISIFLMELIEGNRELRLFISDIDFIHLFFVFGK